MNERIRDLKEQSLVWAIKTLDPDALNDNEWAVAIDEKFAELIVRECATAIINDRRLNDVRSAANGCVRTINEHFGVEE